MAKWSAKRSRRSWQGSDSDVCGRDRRANRIGDDEEIFVAPEVEMHALQRDIVTNFYAATATLWKVEVTASNVCTLGVPSIILWNVFRTSG